MAGVPDRLFTSPGEHGYMNRETRLWFTELDYFEQYIYIERVVESITFDPEDHTKMTYCM